MRKRLMLVWCGIVAVIAYPLAVLAVGHLPMPFGGSIGVQPGLAVSFTLALIAGLLVLPKRLSPLAPTRRGLGVIAWVLAGCGLWASYRFFFAIPTAEDALALRSTAIAQALLGLAAAPVVRRPRLQHAWAWATLAALPLFIPAFPALWDGGSAAAVGLAAAALFVVASLAGWRALMARYRFDGYALALYGVIVLRWVVAAHAGWLLALWVVGIAGRVPIWLPIATALLQAGIAVGLPIAVLAARGQLSFARFMLDRAALEDPAGESEVIRGTAEGKRTAWIISYTGVSNEPRVRRQAAALIADGWRVVVCGFDGHSPRPREWTYIQLPAADRCSPRMRQLLWLLRRAGGLVAVLGWPPIMATAGALLSQWSTAHWLHIKHYLLRVARHCVDLKAELIIANDYFTADVGYPLCRLWGAKLVVDCHEYAVEQSAHDASWVRWKQPAVRAVERYYLARADLVTTVCEGIAALLNADHRLRRSVLVVRSVPIGRPQPFRPTGGRIQVLYHGGIWHVRQLHTAIESMRLWRPEFDLVLRGDADPAYLAELQRLVRRYGLDGRVFFEPPVPFERIVPAANRADIGYFSYANFSRQSEFVLPNKFFEYVMAGLALCVVDLPEMGKLVRRYDLGKLIPEHTPEAIAATINSFSRDEIDRCKRASLVAAQELNWDHEKLHLLAAYNELCAVPAGEEAAARANLALSPPALAT